MQDFSCMIQQHHNVLQKYRELPSLHFPFLLNLKDKMHTQEMKGD